MFFDSTASIGTVRANVWVVRAFAVMLEAQIWVSVQSWNIKSTAFVDIVHEFQKDLSCTSVRGFMQGICRASVAEDPRTSLRFFGLSEHDVKTISKDFGDGAYACRLEQLLQLDYLKIKQCKLEYPYGFNLHSSSMLILPRLLKKGGHKNSKGGGGEEQWVNVGNWGKMNGN